VTDVTHPNRVVPVWLRDEKHHASQAVVDSDIQVRRLIALLDVASGGDVAEPGTRPINAADANKLVTSALALNERLRERLNEITKRVNSIETRGMSVRELTDYQQSK
jgi:small-conductance mechanosensitive channel